MGVVSYCAVCASGYRRERDPLDREPLDREPDLRVELDLRPELDLRDELELELRGRDALALREPEDVDRRRDRDDELLR